ncbi:MAG TPA: glutaredoxin family protein [Jeotgalicoccus aerolatus]|jgi:glutaredoxin 3|nr:glutaredoxin family protein [Jeotgalicoccus aerolatus]HJG32614.1 glutaredoxin family protein [Jeotgalicoccus aerolatus]
MTDKVTIYTSATCPVCDMAKDLLESLDVSYKEVKVDINPISVLKLIGKTRKFTVPQTVINGQVISGFNPDKVIEASYNK